MRMLTFAILGAALFACGGKAAGDSSGKVSEHGGSGGTDATDSGSSGAASGGRSGSPAFSGGAGATSGGRGGSPPHLPDASSAGAPGDAAPSDGAAVFCPIRVSGTLLTEADCYACIIPGIRCDTVGSTTLPPINADACVRLVTTNGTFWCAWYADDALVGRASATIFCRSNPGRVVCGYTL